MRDRKVIYGSLQTWEADFQLTAFGTVLHFRRIPDVLVHKCLLPGWQLDRPDRDPHAVLVWDAPVDKIGSLRLVADEKTATNSLVTWETLPRALDQCLHLAVAEFSPKAVFLHAGVAVWDGAAILIPGRSHAGKSTLTRSLIEAGAVYYSDEFAPVLPNGFVIPYPKPLSLRPSCGVDVGGTREQPVQIDPVSLGWRLDLPPVPVGIVAAVTYRPGSPCGWPKTISKAEATALLLDNTIPMLKAPSRSLGAASKVTRQALCLAGARSEASRFARELLQTLSIGHA
ncbi:MAG: hypothetical protein WCC08_19120 [Terrimicrobiaceae bacterium]